MRFSETLYILKSVDAGQLNQSQRSSVIIFPYFFIQPLINQSGKEFQELLDFVEEIRFDRLGVFTYSHEENTHSFNLEDDVPMEVKHQRAEEIMDLQSTISLEMNKNKIGKTYKVIFDRQEGNYFIGRTQFDSPDVDNEVVVSAKDFYVRIGDFANIEITQADYYDLYGKVV